MAGERLVLVRAAEEYWRSQHHSKVNRMPQEWLLLPRDLAMQLLDELSIAQTGKTIKERLIEGTPYDRRIIGEVMEQFNKYKV